MSEPDTSHKAYWKAKITLVLILLAVWFVAGYVLPIFAVEALNSISLGGFKLGFWFAQQGSIMIFVILILVYVLAVDRLDKRFGVAEAD